MVSLTKLYVFDRSVGETEFETGPHANIENKEKAADFFTMI